MYFVNVTTWNRLRSSIPCVRVALSSVLAFCNSLREGIQHPAYPGAHRGLIGSGINE